MSQEFLGILLLYLFFYIFIKVYRKEKRDEKRNKSFEFENFKFDNTRIEARKLSLLLLEVR